ncbi:hypothetical protein HUJ04_005447 [Dendroctonus ponderosae]|nr:hypothetical protein HUJ04_005447 [Dendroctonus ponderosae]
MSRSCAGTVFNQQNKDTVGYATELLVKDRNFRDPVTSSDEKVFQVSYDGKARVFGPPHSRFRHVGLAAATVHVAVTKRNFTLSVRMDVGAATVTVSTAVQKGNENPTTLNFPIIQHGLQPEALLKWGEGAKNPLVSKNEQNTNV